MKQNEFRKELGQLLMMGVAEPTLSPAEVKVISEIQPGGSDLFSQKCSISPAARQSFTFNLPNMRSVAPYWD
jgi:hypothetical protein